MKSYIVALKNRYPGAVVKGDENSINAYAEDGEHLCSIAKNGAGQWLCNKDESGARDSFSLSPIPKDLRLWKLSREGKIEKDDQYAARQEVVVRALKNHDKIPSIEELELAKNPKADPRSFKHDAKYSDYEAPEKA